MAGLLDPTDDIVSPEERKAITQQNLFSTLLQSGLQLAAAGDNLYPWQRAQMLGQVAQSVGGMPAQQQQMLGNAAQQRLMAQKAADKKREQQVMDSADFKAALAQLPPEMQALARINPQAAMSAVSNYRQLQMQDQREKAAADRQERLIASQLDRAPPTVTHDEYGRPMAWDRVTRTWMPIQSGASGDMRGAYGLPGGGQPGAAADGGAGPAPAAPGQPAVAPSINTGSAVDYRKAFGLGGFSSKIAGDVQDLLEGKMTGGNLEAANARNNYNQVRNEVLKVLTSDMPGRQSKYTTQMVSETLPEAGSLFSGPSGAVSKLDAANRMIESEIQQLESAFNAPNNIKMRADIAGKLKDLYRSQANLSAITQQMVNGKTGGQQQGALQGGGGLPEGATVVGKTKDGRTVYSLNGQQYVK